MSNKEEITIDKAVATIIEWPDKDDFICWNVRHYMVGGDPTDNSIELADYWERCYKIIKPNQP